MLAGPARVAGVWRNLPQFREICAVG